MAQAFLHRDEDIGVAAHLDEDHPVGMQAGEMERGGKQIPPAQAPQDSPFGPREDAREEDCRRRIVAERRAAGDFMKRPHGDPAGGQMLVYGLDTERQRIMADARAFDLRNLGAQLGKGSGLTHGIAETRNG